MRSHTALTPDPTFLPPPTYNVKRVGFLEGISRQTIDDLIGHADALGHALARLDTLAKKTDGGGLSPALQETPLWQPFSVSPDRPVGGTGTAILTPMDRFRANLSLDIEALKMLKARIPD